MADTPKTPKPKPKRPRDELGRPQPWDAENRLDLEDYDALSPQENHRLGREHFNAGRYFPAHEAWETVWKQRKGTPEEELYKGLSQIGAGYTHLHRGNAHGATTLLRRGGRRVAKYPAGAEGVDTERIAIAVLAHADEIEREQADHPSDARHVVDPSGFKPPRI